MIDKSSRYAKTPRVTVTDGSGEPVEILDLRETPKTGGVYFHTPVEGERIDHLAHRYLRDPRKYWRICDAADALDPFDVVTPGRPVLIPPQR